MSNVIRRKACERHFFRFHTCARACVRAFALACLISISRTRHNLSVSRNSRVSRISPYEEPNSRIRNTSLPSLSENYRSFFGFFRRESVHRLPHNTSSPWTTTSSLPPPPLSFSCRCAMNKRAGDKGKVVRSIISTSVCARKHFLTYSWANWSFTLISLSFAA